MSTKNTDGFALTEVLVALLVLGIGLLGMASLQGGSVRANHTAQLRSLATQQVQDMADRIRANPQGVVLAAYDAINIPPSSTLINPGACNVNCAPAAMAAWDTFDWGTANQQLLGATVGANVTAVIAVGGGPRLFLISLNWQERQEGATASAPQTFAMAFRP